MSEEEVLGSSSIIRCEHDENNLYVMINQDLIRNKEISAECRWFIIFCLSFDKSWVISLPYFAKEQNISLEKIRNLANEAIEAGYMKRETYTENGLKRYKYTVSERPRFKKSLLCSEKPSLEKPCSKNKQLKKEQIKESIPKGIPKKEPKKDERISVGKIVKLKKEEILILHEIYGSKAVDDMVRKMDLWMESHGKTRKNYFAELQIWFENDKNKEKKPKPDPERKRANLAILKIFMDKLSQRHVNGNYMDNIKVLDHIFIDKNIDAQVSLHMDNKEFKNTLDYLYSNKI